MSKKNDDFFIKKKSWSIVKDELLGYYFKPYISKILHTQRPVLYVDCFAGKGKFEDGKPGSPIIALDIINECLDRTSVNYIPKVYSVFIDLNYADDLAINLCNYSDIRILSGKYEEKIFEVLKNKDGYNVFLYIDPYGIKALDCSIFDSLALKNFNSIELLINMNSFGFIREACHALGTSFDNNEIFNDLIEYDSTRYDTSDKSIDDLNRIAGGDYWQKIINDYKLSKIDGYEAEKIFSEQYCNRLMKMYKFVLNMPMRIKEGQHPKYRLIHATNHRDGCLLMVDNIYNRWQALQEIQNNQQLSLFETDFDNNIISNDDINKKVINYFSKCVSDSSLCNELARFFVKNGAVCSVSKVKDILKDLERNGNIIFRRIPDKTKSGKPTRFMDEKKGQKVFIRWTK